MNNLVSTKNMLGAILALTLVALLSGCAALGFSKVSQDTSLDDRGYASTERLVSAKWMADNVDNETLATPSSSLTTIKTFGPQDFYGRLKFTDMRMLG